MKQKVTQKGLLPYDSGVVTIKTAIISIGHLKYAKRHVFVKWGRAFLLSI